MATASRLARLSGKRAETLDWRCARGGTPPTWKRSPPRKAAKRSAKSPSPPGAAGRIVIPGPKGSVAELLSSRFNHHSVRTLLFRARKTKVSYSVLQYARLPVANTPAAIHLDGAKPTIISSSVAGSGCRKLCRGGARPRPIPRRAESADRRDRKRQIHCGGCTWPGFGRPRLGRHGALRYGPRPDFGHLRSAPAAGLPRTCWNTPEYWWKMANC